MSEKQAWIKVGVMLSRGESSPLQHWTGSMAKVFLAVACRLNDEQECWPGIPTISKDTGLNRTTVERAISKLEEDGVLEVDRKIGEVNIYHMLNWATYGNSTPGKKKHGVLPPKIRGVPHWKKHP